MLYFHQKLYKGVFIIIDYFLKLEYNAKNILVLTLEKDSQDLAIIVYEDLNRAENIDIDFPYHKEQIESVSEYIDKRNLVSIMIFPIFNLAKSKKLEEEIESIADYYIEHRGKINTKINWFNEKKVTDLYKNIDTNKISLLKYLFEFCENKTLKDDIKSSDFSHLNQ
ncbi:hypothetical protein [Finegoldia magna]|uniref:hypothetical protein n=1 Tax=Finegoldia magna TaxID=1260 RepID=UPI001F4F9B55|nr:hypothetical protein [Finegoldia magna]